MHIRRGHSIAAAAMAASLLFAACSSDDDASDDATEETTTTTAADESSSSASDDSAAEGNIVEVAVAAGDFTTLASLLETAGLVETLSGPGPFTVLAPTDEAFAKVPAETLEALGNDPEALAAVL